MIAVASSYNQAVAELARAAWRETSMEGGITKQRSDHTDALVS